VLDRGNTKHTERRVSALIDMPLWDRAKWKGVLYIWPLELDLEPWLALGFEDDVAARAIFAGWRVKLGEIDKEDRIRISILTGADRLNPNHYSVVRVRSEGPTQVAGCHRREDAVYRTRLSLGERPLRELQLKAAR
jgi:hypothetical protein